MHYQTLPFKQTGNGSKPVIEKDVRQVYVHKIISYTNSLALVYNCWRKLNGWLA